MFPLSPRVPDTNICIIIQISSGVMLNHTEQPTVSDDLPKYANTWHKGKVLMHCLVHRGTQ